MVSVSPAFSQNIEGARDCADATVICTSLSFTDTVDFVGIGIRDIPSNSSCWGTKSEFYPFWYKFVVGKSGSFEMQITPYNGFFNDWDFILYDVTAGCGVGNWIEIACNSSNDCGVTGISTINSTLPQCDPLASSPWESTVYLDSGKTYALIVNAIDFPAGTDPLVFELEVNMNNLPDAAEFIGIEPSFTLSADTLCLGDILSTNNTSTGPGTLTYFWDFGNGITSTAQDTSVQYLTEGTYTVTLEVDNGVCPASLSQQISVLNPTAGPDVEICQGDTALIYATGGSTYLWNPGGFTTDSVLVNPNSTTTYTVTITNESCTVNDDVTVTVNIPPVITIDTNGDNPLCEGDSVELVANPAGTFYQWYFNGNPIAGATNQSYTTSTAGDYTVSVEDTNGCSSISSAAITVVVNPLPVVSIIQNGINPFCANDSVELIANPAGVSYQWFINGNPIAGATNQNYFASADGNYNVIVTDANGCSDSASSSFTAITYPLPVVNISSSGNNPFCEDQDSLLLIATSGFVSYQWYLNGNPIAGATNSTYYTLTEGQYNVMVSDTNGCSDTSAVAFTVTTVPLPTVSINLTGNNPFCDGDSVLLEAEPTGATSYQWFLNGAPIAGATSDSYYASLAGNYNVIVTNANGCYDSASVAVVLTTTPLPVVSIQVAGSNPTCEGDTVELIADPAGVSYQWYLNGTAIVGATNQNYFASVSGTYNVEVTIASGCSDTALTAVNVIINPLPNVSISESDSTSLCQGDSVTLTANPAGATYQWYLNGTAIPGATNQSITVNSSGFYNVLITDANSCTDSALIATEVVVNPLPVVSINQIGGNPICVGDSLILEALPSGMTYQWLFEGTPILGATGQTIAVTDSGFYNVIVSDSLGCSDTASTPVQLSVNPLLVVNISLNGSNPICDGDSVELIANPAGIDYQWFFNGAAIAGATNQNYFATLEGVYNVSVTDTNGCSDTALLSVSVFVNPLPVVSIDPDQNYYCFGETATLTATGGGLVTYQWFLDGALLAGETNSAITTTTAGTYNVFVTDTNGCGDTASAFFVLTFVPLPVVSINQIGGNPICVGDSLILEALPSGMTYQWLFEGMPILGATGQTIAVTDSGFYNVIVSDSLGCSDTASTPVQLSVNPLPVVSISLTGNDTICEGLEATLTAFPSGMTYQWLLDNNPIIGANNETYDATLAGTYSVFLTDTNGCSDTSAQISLATLSIPPASISGDDLLCYSGDVGVLVSSPASSYTWLLNGSVVGTNNDSLIIDTIGNYQVITLNELGCSDTSDVFVVNSDSIEFGISNDTAICLGSAIIIAAEDNPNFTYLWSPSGAVTPSILFTPGLGLQTYYVTVSKDGCERTDSVKVMVNPLPNANAGSDVTVCEGNSITLQATGGISYSWSNGANTDTTTVSPLTTTDYWVDVTDTNGCTSRDSITVFPLPLANVTSGFTSCAGDSVVLVATGGDTYLWSTGSTNDSIYVYVTSDTSFTVLVESQGCEKLLTATVNVLPSPQPLYLTGDTLVCANDLIDKLYAISGGDSSTFVWTITGGIITSGDGTDSVYVTWNSDTNIIKTLSVTETNADSCSNTITFNITFDERQIWMKVVTDDFEDERYIHILWDGYATNKTRDSFVLWRRAFFPAISPWMEIATVGLFDSVYTDGPLSTADTSYEYKLVNKNICGTNIETLPHNSILLRGIGIESSESVVLNWNSYKNWTNGVYNYRIYRKIDDQPELEVYDAVYNDTTITFLNAHDGFKHTYRVLGVENNTLKNIMSWSNEIVIDFRHHIHIHNIFSPNGDGVNETFFIDNIWMWPDNQVWIFNRWGNEVFFQKGYENDWNGGNLPSGTYFYIVEVDGDDNSPYKGALMIQR